MLGLGAPKSIDVMIKYICEVMQKSSIESSGWRALLAPAQLSTSGFDYVFEIPESLEREKTTVWCGFTSCENVLASQ